ncbi:GNAT family N-acetyltransferase [Cellulomonas sp. NPDC055163]
MTAWSVVEAALPPSVVDRAAGPVVGAHRLHAEVQRRSWGHDDFTEPVQHWLGTLRDQEYTERVVLVAVAAEAGRRQPAGGAAEVRDRDVVGAAVVELPRTGNAHLAELDVWVDPDRRREGIGSALMDVAERRAAERGRTTTLVTTSHRGEPPAEHPDALTAASGSGRLDASAPGVRFAARRGYRPEQAERCSVLDVPLDDTVLARHLHAAASVAGPGYRVHSWTDRAPDAWLDDVAVLLTRMSTDIPQAGLDLEEDPWDGARVRHHERVAAATGRGFLVTVAEHVPTGRLAAVTQLETSVSQPGCAWQDATLVLREHRGHRLGMLVKAANLRHTARVRPATRRIHTWNAEENAHMLAINVALGFRPVGVEAIWQRTL